MLPWLPHASFPFVRHGTIFIAVVISVASCDGGRPAPAPERTEFEQLLGRLRDDNEKEIINIRAQWMGAEALVLKMGKDLEVYKHEVQDAQTETNARLDRAASELAEARAEIMALRLEPPQVANPPQSTRDRLLRAYEELWCGRKAGLVEPVEALWTRWGFASADAWAAAWAEASVSPGFDEEATARIDRLCP